MTRQKKKFRPVFFSFCVEMFENYTYAKTSINVDS